MRRARLLAVVLVLAALVGALGASQPLAVSPTVVVSQVYGGGGNAGAVHPRLHRALQPRLDHGRA